MNATASEATDYKTAAEQIAALLAGNEQVLRCFYAADGESVEAVIIELRPARKPSEEALLEDALDKALDVMEGRSNLRNVGEEKRIYGWLRSTK